MQESLSLLLLVVLLAESQRRGCMPSAMKRSQVAGLSSDTTDGPDFMPQHVLRCAAGRGGEGKGRHPLGLGSQKHARHMIGQ